MIAESALEVVSYFLTAGAVGLTIFFFVLVYRDWRDL
jgi:hypothetical protein